MSDVAIFYAELQSAASTIDTAVTEVLMQSADLGSEEHGIGNPASRPALRLALHRHLGDLNQAVRVRVTSANQLSGAARRIADRYADLDVELTGKEQS